MRKASVLDCERIASAQPTPQYMDDGQLESTIEPPMHPQCDPPIDDGHSIARHARCGKYRRAGDPESPTQTCCKRTDRDGSLGNPLRIPQGSHVSLLTRPAS